MTVKTRAELKAENAADFPDNTARLISAADLRGQMDDIVDSALFPEDDIEGPPGPPGSGAMGLYHPQDSGAIGDGTTDDRDALLAADGVAASADNYLFINKIYKIDSNLTLTSGVTFGSGGRLKPASGVTVTLAGGFAATPTRHVFDISLGGDCWPTRECQVTARNYGAVGNSTSAPGATGTNDRLAFQHLIDCRLYFQRAGAIYLDAGAFFISGGPLIVNYGNGFRSIDVIGAGLSYDPGGSFPGTYFRTDSFENLFEVHGARGMKIEGITFEGPFKQHISGTLFGASLPDFAVAGDPYDHLSWIPATARASGALNRFKMCSGIHIDPRGSENDVVGLKPEAVFHTAVRLVVTEALTTAHSAGDTVQGVTLALNDRILQAVSIDIDGWPGLPTNGVYVVQAAGVAPVRATDMDIATEFANSTTVLGVTSKFAAVNCTAGTYAATDWVCNTFSIATFGSTNIEFRQFDGQMCYADYTYPAWTGITGQYGKRLSSAVTIKHCFFRGFGAAVAVKGCDDDGNADFIRMEYCGAQYNVYSFVWGHGQARDQGTVCVQFSISRASISTSVVGKGIGKGHFKAVNSEFSNCCDILDIPTMSITGGVSLDTGYGEAGNRIGRCYSTSGTSGGFEISGGHYGVLHEWWGRVPRWLIDCQSTGVTISPDTSFSNISCPFIIRGNPINCHIQAKLNSPLWMTGVYPPTTVAVGDAFLLHSTMGVLFIGGAVHQGPWSGRGYNEAYRITDGGGRTSRHYGRHMTSSVTEPIPFCATTASPASISGVSTASPMPVALGAWAVEKPLGHAGHFASPPSYSGRTLTLVLSAVPSASVAQNTGYVTGSIILDGTTGNLFVIHSLSGATITAKALNNYNFITGNPLWPSAVPNNLYFTPTGHYTPNTSLELAYASSNTVTVTRVDGANLDGLQLPVGAAKMVNDTTDAITPIVRANSAITAIAGTGTPTVTLTMAGTARKTTTERAGIWFIPRP